MEHLYVVAAGTRQGRRHAPHAGHGDARPLPDSRCIEWSRENPACRGCHEENVRGSLDNKAINFVVAPKGGESMPNKEALFCV